MFYASLVILLGVLVVTEKVLAVPWMVGGLLFEILVVIKEGSVGPFGGPPHQSSGSRCFFRRFVTEVSCSFCVPGIVEVVVMVIEEVLLGHIGRWSGPFGDLSSH